MVSEEGPLICVEGSLVLLSVESVTTLARFVGGPPTPISAVEAMEPDPSR
jgi:hypothetical protein